jgi:outer membrane PBP1 activator LpoA protein
VVGSPPSMVRRSAVLAVVALSVVTVACGSRAGSLTHAQYEKQLNAAGQNLSTQLGKVFSSISGATSVQDVKAAAGVIRQGAQVIDGQADSLHELSPPKDASAANAKLVDGLHELASELRDFAEAAEKLDVAKVQDFVKKAQAQKLPGEVAVQAAIDQLKKAGYKVS